MGEINTKVAKVDFDPFRNQLTIDFTELFNFRWLELFDKECKAFEETNKSIKKWFYSISYTPKNDHTLSIKQLYTNLSDKDANIEYIKELLVVIKKVVKNTNEVYNVETKELNKEKNLKENAREIIEKQHKSINEELNDFLNED